MQVVITCVQSAAIQVNLNDFSVDCLGVYHQIYHYKRLFLGESLLEDNLHPILPVINNNLLLGGRFCCWSTD